MLVRIGVMILFFIFRATHPNNAAYPLWLTSVICEIWSAPHHTSQAENEPYALNVNPGCRRKQGLECK